MSLRTGSRGLVAGCRKEDSDGQERLLGCAVADFIGAHYLFPFRINGNAYGGTYDPRRHQTTCKTAWKKLTVAANLPGLRPYDCRHCAITNLLQNPDVSEETVKAIAGHVSPEILKTYSHIRMECKQAPLDALVKKSFKGNP